MLGYSTTTKNTGWFKVFVFGPIDIIKENFVHCKQYGEYGLVEEHFEGDNFLKRTEYYCGNIELYGYNFIDRKEAIPFVKNLISKKSDQDHFNLLPDMNNIYYEDWLEMCQAFGV